MSCEVAHLGRGGQEAWDAGQAQLLSPHQPFLATRGWSPAQVWVAPSVAFVRGHAGTGDMVSLSLRTLQIQTLASVLLAKAL